MNHTFHAAAAPTLIADADQLRTGGAHRTITEVAVGVLMDEHPRYLMTTRPAGKVYAGYWEFPGGKVEAGESVVEALQRELMEEINIEIDAASTAVWRTQVVDYPHALVRLHFCKVRQWRGELSMVEGQRFQWISLPAKLSPILPGSLPVLTWLEQQTEP